jgi:hypothetical protein
MVCAMGSRGHYVKGSDRGSLPGRLVSVVIRSKEEPDRVPSAGAVPATFRSAHVAYCCRRGSGYSPARFLAFGSASAFWRWMESAEMTGRKAYLFSPVASDSLTLLQFWDRLDLHGCGWDRPAPGRVSPNSGPRGPDYAIIHRWFLNGTPDILEYTIRGRRYRWCSGRNYYRDTEGRIAAATGYRWRFDPDRDPDDWFTYRDPEDRAAMWLHAIQTLAIWWRGLDAGRFATTTPALAYSFLKSRLPPKSICTHTDAEVLKIERSCCHGGRSTAWYTGDIRPKGRHTPAASLPYPTSNVSAIPGPIYHYDVRSMYPVLMRDMTYPVKLSHRESSITPERLAGLCEVYHVLAYVQLETDTPEYPHRRNNRVIYPIGTFGAYLTTPELRAALSAGHVRKVHDAVCYYTGRPFVVAAESLLQMRADARESDNESWELFTKQMTNSMTGKLAQRKGDWVASPEVVAKKRWGSWLDYDRTTGRCIRYRSIAGLSWRFDRSERGTGTLTAAYAVLTAHGRMMMREVRTRLPPKSVLSQDTDGIWVTAAGAKVLTQTYGQELGKVGSLRLVKSVTAARFWDSKHYYADGRWIVAGLCHPEFSGRDASYADHARHNPIRMNPCVPPIAVVDEVRKGCLTFTPADGVVGSDGWLLPYRLPASYGHPHAPPPEQGELFDQ